MQTNVRGVDEQLWRALRVAAIRRGVSLGVLLNEILRAWLASQDGEGRES